MREENILYDCHKETNYVTMLGRKIINTATTTNSYT